MSFTQKIDVLELLIELIFEHEQKLDQLIAKIENLEILNTDVRGNFTT
jgi:hypothetical protein